jgi:hypothetical protein
MCIYFFKMRWNFCSQKNAANFQPFRFPMLLFSIAVAVLIATSSPNHMVTMSFRHPSVLVSRRPLLLSSRNLKSNSSNQNDTNEDEMQSKDKSENDIMILSRVSWAIQEFWNNMDDIVDDFMNKRMGNGELFYGKRKFNPSGKIDGSYNGFGLSDKGRIEGVKMYKEMREGNRDHKILEDLEG